MDEVDAPQHLVVVSIGLLFGFRLRLEQQLEFYFEGVERRLQQIGPYQAGSIGAQELDESLVFFMERLQSGRQPDQALERRGVALASGKLILKLDN